MYNRLSNNVELDTQRGLLVSLKFGGRQEQAVKVTGKIKELLGEQASLAIQSVEAAQMAAVSGTYNAMLREIRSWALWLIVMGVIQVVASGVLNASWGILLIIVGLASFYFRDAAMFVVYSVTIAWAGVSNLLSGSGMWQIFALVQAFFVYTILQQFRRFRRAQAEETQKLLAEHPEQIPLPDRSARIFPWAGLVLGSLSLTGLVLVFFGAFILTAMTRGAKLPTWIGRVEGLSIDGAVLGLAVSLAALLSGSQRKIVSIVGCVLSGMTLLIELGLILIGRL
jgi:hypothetical protein